MTSGRDEERVEARRRARAARGGLLGLGGLAWAWVVLIVVAALAEVLSVVDLRLALDFQHRLP